MIENKFLELYLINEDAALNYLENIVVSNPQNIDAKIALALLVQRVPFDDFPTSYKLLNEILMDCPENIKALILISYVENVHLGQITDSTMHCINQYLKRGINTILEKQLLLLKAEYYRFIDKDTYVKNLQKSIQEDDQASNNYFLLGSETGNIDYLKVALEHVQHVYTNDELKYFNPIDFDKFISESIRGVILSSESYNFLKKLVFGK